MSVASGPKISVNLEWVGVVTERTAINEEECLNAQSFHYWHGNVILAFQCVIK